VRDECRPAGLVRGAQALAGVAVEVLAERDLLAPHRIVGRLDPCPVAGTAAVRAGLKVVGWRSEGVAGDGWWWRNKASLLASRALGRGDIVRLTLAK
jgi:hypothetical protein